jgi:hypothetical protein
MIALMAARSSKPVAAVVRLLTSVAQLTAVVEHRQVDLAGEAQRRVAEVARDILLVAPVLRPDLDRRRLVDADRHRHRKLVMSPKLLVWSKPS